mmetsp:Transcript_78222/g.138128  ORF Transcript_78222/g.138128 Transcript_78222/m.138128 type:complete len:222 (-) Transcript_78222:2010-2675(-)
MGARPSPSLGPGSARRLRPAPSSWEPRRATSSLPPTTVWSAAPGAAPRPPLSTRAGRSGSRGSGGCCWRTTLPSTARSGTIVQPLTRSPTASRIPPGPGLTTSGTGTSCHGVRSSCGSPRPRPGDSWWCSGASSCPRTPPRTGSTPGETTLCGSCWARSRCPPPEGRCSSWRRLRGPVTTQTCPATAATLCPPLSTCRRGSPCTSRCCTGTTPASSSLALR